LAGIVGCAKIGRGEGPEGGIVSLSETKNPYAAMHKLA
jgi:hypothetical protein